MLHQLVSAQFMVKAAWELVWLYIKTTKQITFVRHMVSPLCDTSTPPTRHTAPQQWGMRPRKRDYAGWTGVQTLTAVHQLSVWETLLGYWTGFFFSKMGKYPSFKDCCKSKKKKMDVQHPSYIVRCWVYLTAVLSLPQRISFIISYAKWTSSMPWDTKISSSD